MYGSKYNLPTSEKLTDKYGVQKGTGGQVQALGSYLYDVLNNIVFDAQITKIGGN